MSVPGVYLIGGAGVGKSTMMDAITYGLDFGPLAELHSKRNTKALVWLRGQSLSDGGLYLGNHREQFPGTDGLDLVSQPVMRDWLETGGPDSHRYVVAEGSRFATRKVLSGFADATDFLLVYLHAPEDVRAERLKGRGSNQAVTFLAGSATAASNRLREANALGWWTMTVDTSDPDATDVAIDLVRTHLGVASGLDGR